jgi:fimbrial chaperone protein
LKYLSILVALAAIAIVSTRATLASDLTVQPLAVHVKPGAVSATLSLDNQGTTPLRLQVTGYAWLQNVDGNMDLQPTDDLVFFPQLVTVDPGGHRALRVGLINPKLSTSERTYRIFIEELPSLDSQFNPSAAAMVTVRTKMGIPVFLDPARPAPKPRINFTLFKSKKLIFHLLNDGNAHFVASKVNVIGKTAGGVAVFARTLSGWYILAGGDREFDVDVNEKECSDFRSVTIEATTDSGVVRQTYPVPEDGCR